MKDKIEAQWVKRWKGNLGFPSKRPWRVMRAYLDHLNISMNALDEQMCWECWPEELLEDNEVSADE